MSDLRYGQYIQFILNIYAEHVLYKSQSSEKPPSLKINEDLKSEPLNKNCFYFVVFLPGLSFCVCEYFSVSMFVCMWVQRRATDMAVSLAQTQETTSKHSQLLQTVLCGNPDTLLFWNTHSQLIQIYFWANSISCRLYEGRAGNAEC